MVREGKNRSVASGDNDQDDAILEIIYEKLKTEELTDILEFIVKKVNIGDLTENKASLLKEAITNAFK